MGFNTLVVNLWAGPGTGKSTNAALLGELDSEFILTDIQEGERTTDDITEAVVTRLRAQYHAEE